MKSLEHIIREIREGKAEKGSKKTLEGSIRKVMKGEKESSFADRTTKPITDDVGGLAGSGTGGEPKLHAEAIGVIGTDEYQGNQFKSVRTATPHIKPPAGAGSHSQAPENVSRQRTLAKERSSMTLHGKVTEQAAKNLEKFDQSGINPTDYLSTPLFTTGAGAEIGGVKGGGSKAGRSKAGQPARKSPDTTPSIPKGPPIQIPGGRPSPVQPGPSPKPANEPGRETPVVPKPGFKPYVPPTREKPSEPPANVPEPAKPATPKTPAPVAPTTVPTPKELPKTVPLTPGALPSKQPEPEKAPKPQVEPKTKPQAEPKNLPAIDIPAPKPSAEPKTAADTAPKTAAAPEVAPTPAAKTAAATDTSASKSEPEKSDKRFPLSFSAMAMPDIFGAQKGITSKHPSASRARGHRRHVSEEVADEIRKKIQNMPRPDAGDRKSIEYVGRKDSDPKSVKQKTSRLATIKNVIDEAKKIKFEAEFGKEKKYVYPNDTEVVIGPNMKRNFLDVEDSKLPKDYENK